MQQVHNYIITQQMIYQEERAFLLANFQKYRTIQSTVIFLHGLPTALSQQDVLANEVQRLGVALRVSIQNAGKDFYTAFVEYQSQISAAMAIISLDGNWLMNRQIRVFYGSTKFCPHYLKGHACRLADCNYAHYFDPNITHLKDQAKEIDHQGIARMFLTQNYHLTQQIVYSMLQANYSINYILPLDLRKLSREFLGVQFGEILIRQETQCAKASKEVPAMQQEEWGLLSSQIKSQVIVDEKKTVEEVTEVKKSPIQQFLDGAQRFLTKLIFQSSTFVY